LNFFAYFAAFLCELCGEGVVKGSGSCVLVFLCESKALTAECAKRGRKIREENSHASSAPTIVVSSSAHSALQFPRSVRRKYDEQEHASREN
jgi:hypothetical protein